MTIVRIVRWPGGVPEGSIVTGRDLIVLADDTGRRAVPLWLRVSKQLWRLLDRPGEDAVMAGVLEEAAARLLDAAAVEVTAVDIEPADEDVLELRSDTAAARVGLATAAGTRHVQVSAGYGLALAAAAGAPVRVADAVMGRLAVPVQGGDVLAPFLPPAAAQPPRHPGLRRRPEPRNMTFAGGLDYWELAGLPRRRPAALAGLLLHHRGPVRGPGLRSPGTPRFRRPGPDDRRRRLPRPHGHLPRTAAHRRRRRPRRAASGGRRGGTSLPARTCATTAPAA